MATSPSVPDLVVSECSGLRVSRSGTSSFLELGVVLKGAFVAAGAVRDRAGFESWERVARVACWPVEIIDFHILFGVNVVIWKELKMRLKQLL